MSCVCVGVCTQTECVSIHSTFANLSAKPVEKEGYLILPNTGMQMSSQWI